MRVWKPSSVMLLAVLATAGSVQAEEGKKKHMVDMADGLNTQEFYDSKNPDAIWSSELKTPWAKSGAINAYEDNDSATNKTEGTAKEESLGASSPAATTGQVTGQVNGKTVDADQLVNIRVLYTMDAEKSRASFSPVSAQNELFRQMSKTCSNGFQKIAEWSEPVEGSDYYLYYQFKCMEKR